MIVKIFTPYYGGIMKSYRIFSFLSSVVLILSMSMAIVPSAYAGPAANEKKQDGGEQRGYDPDTGQLIFVGAPEGELIASAGGAGPMGFVNAYGAAFGLSNPASEVTSLSSADYGGNTVTRYQQVYQGVPVFGGNLVVTTGESGGLVSMAGKISRAISVDVNPVITAEQAIATAQSVTLKAYKDTYGLKAENLSFSQPVLWIYDEKLFTTATFGPQLVWKVEVTAAQGAPVHEVVLVDAQAGKVAVHYNTIDTQWTTPPTAKVTRPARLSSGSDVTAQVGTPLWTVYDAANALLYHPIENYYSPIMPATTGAGVCSEASVGCPIGEASGAKNYVLDTYNFYLNVNGRDSIDNANMRLKSVVHYGGYAYTNDWYYNAYWDGTKMVYGELLAVDDVTAHELTHGVTDHTSGLIYMYQSGAINESLSDVWGELVDLSYHDDYVTNADTAYRWLMGEDITLPADAFRSMSNPPLKGDPDRMLSPLFYTGFSDEGGVHSNSGVNNKAAYLMTDGGTFNGKVITGLGINKVAAIYYQAQTMHLFPSANYLDLYYALNTSCEELYGSGSNDCAQVLKATQAVQMNLKPATVIPVPVTSCPVNYTKSITPLISDDFESGLGQWSFSGEGDGSPLATTSWVAAAPKDNILNETTALWATGFDGLYDGTYQGGEESATLDLGALPAGQQIYLNFDHMFLFEAGIYRGVSYYYDGGVLEYSTNSGGTWTDAKPLFSAGVNYNGTIYTSPTWAVNPLGGKSAFIANSRQYPQNMRYNLTSLAGKNVQLRWRIGYDQGADWGWYLDNVDVHTCSLIPAIPLQTLPVNTALVGFNPAPLLNWNDVPGADHYVVQVSTDKLFGSFVFDDISPISQYQIPSALAPNTPYYWRVSARNEFDGTKGWSLVRSFRTAMTTPVLGLPLDTDALKTDRPDFDWGDVIGATGYTVQVSKVNTFATIAFTGSVLTPISQFTPTVDLPINSLLYWRVKANGANPSAWSDPFSFTTVNPPTVPVLVTPLINALVTDSTPYSPRLDWNPSTIAPLGSSTLGNYYVQVDNDADFSSPTVDDALVSSDVFLPGSYTIPLNANTKYYWRVRSSNTANDYSAWSAVRYFRTPMLPPALLQPGDTDVLKTDRPDFDWSDVDGATGYTLQVSKSSNFVPIAFTTTIAQPISQFTPTVDLPINSKLYWRVKANGLNPGIWSGPSLPLLPFSFTTVNPPTVPVLVAPLINALTTDAPRLDWNPSTIAPLGSSTLGNYYVQVDNDADFSSPTVDDALVSSDVFLPGSYTIPLNPNTKYYWRVRSSNTANDYSAWSAVRYFRTALLAPTLVTPVDNAVLTTLKPAFDWDDVSSATSYTIQISKVASFIPLLNTATVTPSTYTPAVNLTAGDVYWRVKANGLNGPSLWSDTRKLSVTSAGADTDGDGLPDGWEINGYNAVDLPALGADYRHKDIFVEMDYMPASCGDGGGYVAGGLVPSQSVLDRIAASFADSLVSNLDGVTGINIHLELGNEVPCDTDLNSVTSEFYAIKNANFDPNRAAIYHYMLWAVGYNGGQSSGLSFGIPATDFIVTLGSWGNAGTDDQKVGTFIHELGHNLNLTHGGVDGNNYKPNYLSVMNYLFQTRGVYRNGSWGNFDYQRVNNVALNESALNEKLGLNNPAALLYGTTFFCNSVPVTDPWTRMDTLVNRPIDWNCDGDTTDTSVKVDINNDDLYTVISGQNNWPAVVYTGGGIIGSGASPQALLSLAESFPIVEWNELTWDEQQKVDELNPVP
jgi:Zn-dependent metalloprotease